MVGLGYTSLAGWGACVYCGGADRSAPPAAGASGAVQKGGWGGCLPPLTSLVYCYTSSRNFSAGGSLPLRVKAVVNMTPWVVP